MLTKEMMISLCWRAEEIAMKSAFKVYALTVTTYSFGDGDAIALYAKKDEDDEDSFSEILYSNSTLPITAEAIVSAFEGYLAVEG